jgi:hypothetical protein
VEIYFAAGHQSSFFKLLSRFFAGESHIGQRVVLPESFQRGPKHFMQLYQDAMAVVLKVNRSFCFTPGQQTKRRLCFELGYVSALLSAAA